ncbi:hypothetical protein QJS10_CPA01g02198 [Acorus calamus]|uniref:CHCH domain-containing protein n=1 Tax=Acorus calamus TaxID=4465 RepID=A0AAV9FJ16_ACOCL|nr:hypothetical protein QJS10_CPA01g02198 [Acorus calamus]
MERPSPQPLCPKEALDLLNCATGADFDPDKCLRFLNALRACVLEKKVKKFSLSQSIDKQKAGS